MTLIPPHPDGVPDLMADLEAFLNNDDVTVPHLVRIAIAHYQFETIHPFLDGNGRIGRLLVPLYLVSRGLLAKPSLYLSDFFEKNRTSYYDALMRVRVANDLQHWVIFFLSGVAQTASKGRDVFSAVLKLRTEADASVMSLGRRSSNARAALNMLYRKPILTAAELAVGVGVSQPTADVLIRSLVDLGILNETTGQQRYRSYAFDRYLELFLT
ncbi:MAG: Fic family protein [Cypionkella sp.]